MDNYYEQMTPAYRSRRYEIYNFAWIAMTVIAVVIIPLSFLIGAASGILAVLFYFSKQREYIEYEYIFTNGDIDIDQIVEAKKRKNVISFSMNQVVMLAPQGSDYLDDALKGQKIKAYVKEGDGKVYVAIVNKGNSLYKVHFTPDEELVKLCFKSNPKAVKKY